MRLLAEPGQVNDPLTSWRGIGTVTDWTTAAVGAYSLPLAAYAGLAVLAGLLCRRR